MEGVADRRTDGVAGTGRDGGTEDQNVWPVKNPPEKPQAAYSHFLPLLLLLLGSLYEDPSITMPFGLHIQAFVSF